MLFQFVLRRNDRLALAAVSIAAAVCGCPHAAGASTDRVATARLPHQGGVATVVPHRDGAIHSGGRTWRVAQAAGAAGHDDVSFKDKVDTLEDWVRKTGRPAEMDMRVVNAFGIHVRHNLPVLVHSYGSPAEGTAAYVVITKSGSGYFLSE
jgi:hypothetical protein